MSEKFTLFWGEEPFSQWSPAEFTIDGIEYNCAEQWMMANKAIMFNDEDSLHAIMEADHPGEQKKLGRKVKGFDVDKWVLAARDIVFVGNFHKFTQNEDMKDVLVSKCGTTLVEASPYDKIWGIGLSASDPRCLDRSQWNGLNWLGEVLTILCNDFVNGVERDLKNLGISWS